MKIAIDAMGGDNAPKEVVLGAAKAVKLFLITYHSRRKRRGNKKIFAR